MSEEFSEFDREAMRRALALADRGLFTTTPNPRVGCVIARDGVVIGEGFHARAGEPHAEVLAIADAVAKGHETRGATAYVTLEPCNHHGKTPPCVQAILEAGLRRVVVAMRDPHPVASGGAERLRGAAVVVDLGLMEEDARELNVGFVSRVTRGVPWVRTKIAASIDGRTALANGESRWITGERARADGHAWRARACAILTGVGTVLQDDPALTVRALATPRQPLRVVVDPDGKVPRSARVLADDNALLVTAGARHASWDERVATVALPDSRGRVDFGAMMRMLADRGVNELHVEAGARLNGALLEHGMVDEVLLYVAPSILGDPARGEFDRLQPLGSIAQRARLAFSSVDRIGDDVRIVARVVH